ncbi:TPA: hypothetical protein ACXDF7_005360, partial [Klebsiella pneumoniae]
HAGHLNLATTPHATSLNAFYVKYQTLNVKLELFFCNDLLTITAGTASVGIKVVKNAHPTTSNNPISSNIIFMIALQVR